MKSLHHSVKIVRQFLVSLTILAWLFPSSNVFAQWDTAKAEGCVEWGKRQYSAKLLSNPSNDWSASCKNYPITIQGVTEFTDRCDDHGWGGMWGIWFVEDDSCKANWAAPKDDGCKEQNIRTYSARLDNIPDSDWQGACRKTALTVGGEDFATPTRCNDLGAGGMWGEFDVHDSTCSAKWGSWAEGSCVDDEKRVYSSRLENTQTSNWDAECNQTGFGLNGITFEKPLHCLDKGISGMWGEVEIEDPACAEELTYDEKVADCMETRIDQALIDGMHSCSWGEVCGPAIAYLIIQAFCHVQ